MGENCCPVWVRIAERMGENCRGKSEEERRSFAIARFFIFERGKSCWCLIYRRRQRFFRKQPFIGGLIFSHHLLLLLVVIFVRPAPFTDRKSTRLNSSHRCISY